MSRLNTQTGLSGSPGTPTGVGRVNPGSFTPVADNTAGNLLGLVQQAVGTIGAIQQVQKRKTDEELASAYESSSANLIRLQQEAQRDPNKEGAFLRAYDAAHTKFSGTKYEAEITDMGEGTRTLFAQRAERKAESAAKAFVDLRVMPAINEALSDEEIRNKLLSVEDYSDRLDAVNNLITEYMPENAGSLLTEDARQGIQAKAIDINNRLQAQFEDGLQKQRLEANQMIAQDAIISLASRDLTWDGYMSQMESADVDPITAQRRAAQGLDESLDAAYIAGDVESMHYASAAAYDAHEQATDPASKRLLAQTVAAGDAYRGDLVSKDFGEAWSAIAVEFGPEAANEVVLNRARDLLSLEYGDTAYSITDPNMLEDFGFKGAYKRSIMEQVSKVVRTIDSPKLPATVQDTVDNMFYPNLAPDGSAKSAMNLSSAEWAQAAATLIQKTSIASDLFPEGETRDIAGVTVTGPEEYTRLLAEATTNLPLRAAVIADRFANSRHEANFVSTMLSPDSGYLESEDGFQIVLSSMEELGGIDAITKHVKSDDVKYALSRTFRSAQPSLATYQAELAAYRQVQVKIGDSENETISSAMRTPEFARALMGTSWGRADKAYGLDQKTIDTLIGYFPLQTLQDQKLTPQILASKMKPFMESAGIYAIWEPPLIPGGRDIISVTNSRAIPETVGFDYKDVGDSLADITTPMSRFIATQLSGGETNNMWRFGAERWRDMGFAPSEATLESEINRLKALHKKGQVNFRVAVGQATRDAVPILMTVVVPGKEPTSVWLGDYNFNNGFMQSRGARMLNPNGGKNRRREINLGNAFAGTGAYGNIN